MNKFSMLCRILGVSKFKAVRAVGDSRSLNIDAGLTSKSKAEVENHFINSSAGHEFNVNANFKESKNFYAKYSLENEYYQDDQLDFDKAYNEGIKYAIDNNLFADEGVKSLIENRNPAYGLKSMIKNQRIVVNVSREINRYLELSLQLNYFAKANLIKLRSGGGIESELKANLSVDYLKKDQLLFELDIEFER